MTTIVYKDGEFAWDTQSTWTRAHLGTTKVVNRDGVVFGVAGEGAVADVMEFMDIPDREVFNPLYNPRKWIITELSPAIKNAAEEAGLLRDSEGFKTHGTHIIVYVDGLAGYLDPSGGFVTDISGVLGVGSGSEYALGAIAAGASLQQAVEIAIQYDLYSGGEVQTMQVEETYRGENK